MATVESLNEWYGLHLVVPETETETKGPKDILTVTGVEVMFLGGPQRVGLRIRWVSWAPWAKAWRVKLALNYQA